jgi:predicted metal-dependent hydrolase
MLKPMLTYDRLYVEFLYYFNEARDYFECHEVMEELWMEEGRNHLYQGLLQIAVGLYHHFNGNVSGSIKLFTAALDKLSHYPPEALGIDLAKLVQDSRLYVEQLSQFEQSPFEPYDLHIVIQDEQLVHLVEQLKLNPPAAHDKES